MTEQELRQKAVDYLAKAFRGETSEVHVVHCALQLLLHVAPEAKEEQPTPKDQHGAR